MQPLAVSPFSSPPNPLPHAEDVARPMNSTSGVARAHRFPDAALEREFSVGIELGIFRPFETVTWGRSAFDTRLIIRWRLG